MRGVNRECWRCEAALAQSAATGGDPHTALTAPTLGSVPEEEEVRAPLKLLEEHFSYST